MEPYVGMKIYGYCQGYFDGDSYGEKIIEAMGPDWVVARRLWYDGPAHFATFKDRAELVNRLQAWSVKSEDD